MLALSRLLRKARDMPSDASLFLCDLSDLEETGAFGLTIEGKDGPIDILVAKMQGHSDKVLDKEIVAYRNSCPHISTPLETFDHEFLDSDDPSLLVCSTHGARFRLADGYCIIGPCRGKSLTPIAVTLRKNKIFLVSTEI